MRLTDAAFARRCGENEKTERSDAYGATNRLDFQSVSPRGAGGSGANRQSIEPRHELVAEFHKIRHAADHAAVV